MEGGVATENSAVPLAVAPEAAVDAEQRLEGAAAVEEDSVAPMVVAQEAAADADQLVEDAAPEDGKHGDTEGNVEVTPEEMRTIIEVIADTGKFWHDWNFLKRLLSLQLKQVLAEYSEAQMVNREDGHQQNSLSGETYSEMFIQLNDALLRFEEGPPFTLQRLCEILLDPKGTYKKLSKLGLALEKNLLVTSTMTKCTDPYPAAHGPNSEATGIAENTGTDGPNSEGTAIAVNTGTHGPNSEGTAMTENTGAPVPNSEGTAITEDTAAADVEPERLPDHPAAIPNGTEHVEADGDEEMVDAEAEGVSGSHDVEMQEEKPDHTANVNSNAALTCEEPVDASDISSDPQS